MWRRRERERATRESRWLSILRLGCLAALLLSGCAARQHISRGDELADKGMYNEAIAAYQKALRISPENEAAETGIRRVRREAVRAVLREAKLKLQKGEYAEALSDGMRARRMPLDLDEVELAGDVDETIASASRHAEDRVRQWSEAGLFLLAVELADQVAQASPSESRQRWADEVRARASEHFESLAGELAERGMPGSAAMQLAMAKRIGSEAETARVLGLWDAFTEPICFAAPGVEVKVTGKNTAEITETIENAATAELDTWRARCGEGTRPLGVVIEVTDAEIVDRKETAQAADALPGSGIETVEVYYEERPYVVEEEVTEYETRSEKQERRDCAPRPGRPRGCETWIEEVEVRVPIKRLEEVRKVERIKKTRPAKGPFPPDKVVTYEIATITRQIRFNGKVAVTGAESEPRQLEVVLESADSANDEVRHPKMLVRADPMQVKSMEELRREAGELVANEVRKAVSAAVADWSRADREQARKRVLEGQLPQAEEIYLRLIALGAVDDPNLKKFFRDRYGKPVGTVMDYLLVAMGHSIERRRPGDTESVSSFPKRGSGYVEPERVVAPTEAQVEEKKATDPVRPDVTRMEDDELRALEEASFDENRSRAVPGAVTPVERTPAEGAPVEGTKDQAGSSAEPIDEPPAGDATAQPDAGQGGPPAPLPKEDSPEAAPAPVDEPGPKDVPGSEDTDEPAGEPKAKDDPGPAGEPGAKDDPGPAGEPGAKDDPGPADRPESEAGHGRKGPSGPTGQPEIGGESPPEPSRGPVQPQGPSGG